MLCKFDVKNLHFNKFCSRSQSTCFNMEFLTNDDANNSNALTEEIISDILDYMPNYGEPKMEVDCNLMENSITAEINNYNIADKENISPDLVHHEFYPFESHNDNDKATIMILDDDNNNSSQNTPQYFDIFQTAPACNYLKEDDIKIEEELPEEEEYNICSYCNSVFSPDEFNLHVCEYDDNKILIPDQAKIRTDEISKNRFSEKLKDNEILLKNFFKECLKIDTGGTNSKKLDGPHPCSLCERKFVHASGLYRHMEKHALDLIPINSSNTQTTLPYVVVTCLSCGRVFFSKEDFSEHYDNVHIPLPNHEYTDEYSNFDENDSQHDDFDVEGESELDLHKLENGSYSFVAEQVKKFEETFQNTENFKINIINSILQCEFCSYLFISTADLLIHESKHDPHRAFECFECEIFVMTIKDIFIHWKTECPFSKEITRQSTNIQRYFVCNLCEHKFTSHEQLYEHRYTFFHFFPRYSEFSDILTLCCEYCGSPHTKAKSAIEHYEQNHKKVKKTTVSNKDRQYLCDVCGKSYTQSSHLWQHLRFHRGVKPFACSEPGCNRKFTIRPDLNDHIRKCHTGERPYHCLVCDKRFLTGSVFYQHRLIHRGERRYGCDDCGKRFYRADALKNHQRIHTGEKPYPCLYCSKSFRQRGDRDKHVRARHANLEANARAISAMANQKANEQPNGKDVVYIGNMAFPSSMFKPLIKDIDENDK